LITTCNDWFLEINKCHWKG